MPTPRHALAVRTPPRATAVSPWVVAALTVLTVLAALGCSPSFADPPAPPTAPRISPGQRDYCNLLYGCDLPRPPGFCPAPDVLGKPDFDFDSTRCSEARTLDGRGVKPTNPVVGFQLYRFLGLEYRVVYWASDTLPLSVARLEFLLQDLPLAARLVSHYQDEPYTAQYLDAAHTYFQGTKGKHLWGQARLISGSTAEKHLFYFGTGTAEIAFWTLKGPALLDFSYWPVDGTKPGVGYRMKLLVFPGNGFINAIMNLGLFKKVVIGKVREVLDDITATAHKLAQTGGADLLQSPQWTPDEKKKIAAFLKLP